MKTLQHRINEKFSKDADNNDIEETEEDDIETLDENLNKVVWEGWTAQDFINDLEPLLAMVMRGGRGISTKAELKKWCMDNQPYYKKYIPAVVNYFAKKYGLK